MESESTPQEALPEFSPPPAYALEPEFLEAAPRQIPGFVYDSAYVKKAKQIQRGLLIAAVVCMGLQFVPFIKDLSFYILPLGYVGWLGVALILFYLGAVISLTRGSGPMKYFTHGQPVVVQILELVKQPTVIMNGSETHFAFVAVVQMVHPETGERVVESVSSDNFASDTKARYHTSLQVGDYVTALYLPENKSEPLKIYGFLGFNPEVNYLQLEEKNSAFTDMVTIVVVALFFGGLFMALYSMERYETLDFPINALTISVVGLGALAGLGCLIGGYLYQRKQQRDQAARNEAALASGGVMELERPPEIGFGKLQQIFITLALIAGAPLMGGLLSGTALLFLNGFLDTSEPRQVPVTLGERFTETQSLIFRQYKVKYTLEGETEERDLSTSPLGLFMLMEGNEGVALVKEGAMGWPWVATILPAGGLVSFPEEGTPAESSESDTT